MSERAERPAAVAAEETVSVVLDQHQTVPVCDGPELVGCRGDTGVVHHTYRSCAFCDGGLDLICAEVERVLTNIDKHRSSAMKHERRGGGDERVARDDHL